MNFLPPAIQAALLRADTGLPGGGGLPSPTQDLTLQFSNLAQVLAGSGPRIRAPGYGSPPTSAPESSTVADALPDSVKEFLPAFLRPDIVNQWMSQGFGFQQPRRPGVRYQTTGQPTLPLEGTPAGRETYLPEPIDRAEFVRSGNEIIRQRNASGRNGFLEGELGQPPGPSEFYYQSQPGGEEELPLSVQQQLPPYLRSSTLGSEE